MPENARVRKDIALYRTDLRQKIYYTSKQYVLVAKLIIIRCIGQPWLTFIYANCFQTFQLC